MTSSYTIDHDEYSCVVELETNPACQSCKTHQIGVPETISLGHTYIYIRIT